MPSFKLNTIFNAAAILPAILGMISAVFMAYVFWWPPKPAYEPINPSTHRVSYQDGFIRIHREYCSNATVPITIYRDLVRITGKGEANLRVTLPQTVQSYEPGCHEIDRIFEIPKGTPAGNYQLVHIAVWNANPFRTDAVRLPILSVAIPPQQ